jgi:hypothetical protein
MRRVHLVLLASMLTTTGATLAACGGDDTSNSGSGGGSGGTTSSSTTAGPGGSGGGDAGADVDNGAPSDHYPAPHSKPPQVVNCGGPVMDAPNVYPIYFQDDSLPFIDDVQTFVNGLGAQPYWPAVATEYGVGALTPHDGIHVAEDSPGNISDNDVQSWLLGHIADGSFPAPDGNTLYAIFYTANTVISMSGGGMNSRSCFDFGGYHNDVQLPSGQLAAYAVIPRCSNFDGFMGIDAVTAAASHEFIEAATDPFPSSNTPGYCQVDNDHIYWLFALGGGETGDMCAQDLSSFTKFAPFDYTIQRSWSNQSAFSSHDPCVPIPAGSGPYFNAAPVLTDTIDILGTQIHGVKIPANQTGVVEVDLFSDGDTGGPWDVDAFDFAQLTGQGSELAFQWDRTSGQNGEKLHLSITVVQESQYHAEIFFITSRKNGVEHSWVGIVGN